MTHLMNRRSMLKRSAAAGAGAMVLTNGILARGQSPNEKLNIACIGIGGRGSANVNGVKRENLVALCDVDKNRGGKMFEANPKAKQYTDFRKMLDELDSQLDAVVVSTPDHTHYHPAIMALRMGKHLYCEKPLAHSVAECRFITDEAKKQGVATQLGAQRHAMSNMHRVVELIKSGAIGQVTECHAWIGGSRGMPSMPSEFPEVPDHLDWDLWLGPAEYRQYSPAYCPYKWRFWWDFGTGETGNWGCHVLDIPYWALDLKYPTAVKASGPELDPERTPKSMHVEYTYPARGDQPGLPLHWYHTTKPPCIEEYGIEAKPPGTGVLFVGSKGMLMTSFGNHVLLPEDKFADFEYPEPFIPDSPGFHKEWILAAKGGEPATCNFDYSGPMAESVILGNTCYQLGKNFAWDAENLKAVGVPEAEALIHPTFRKGWEW